MEYENLPSATTVTSIILYFGQFVKKKMHFQLKKLQITEKLTLMYDFT